ncbi:MAG: stage II sporulation protein R [Clostridia bacterium]|nr:stage II sporulation protein R [Clostridia bacterium]
MKKFITFFALIAVIVVGGLCLPQKEEYDYLRLHIRANSNSSIDQNVKYQIKDMMVETLTPILCNVQSKQQAQNIVEEYKYLLKYKCEEILKQNGFSYKANIKLANEYFPTRTYSNTTLESGYYDAVIVELGEAVGDNWWCVMYPPLCFVNKNENAIQIKYKSKIVEWFKMLFD